MTNAATQNIIERLADHVMNPPVITHGDGKIEPVSLEHDELANALLSELKRMDVEAFRRIFDHVPLSDRDMEIFREMERMSKEWERMSEKWERMSEKWEREAKKMSKKLEKRDRKLDRQPILQEGAAE